MSECTIRCHFLIMYCSSIPHKENYCICVQLLTKEVHFQDYNHRMTVNLKKFIYSK